MPKAYVFKSLTLVKLSKLLMFDLYETFSDRYLWNLLGDTNASYSKPFMLKRFSRELY